MAHREVRRRSAVVLGLAALSVGCVIGLVGSAVARDLLASVVDLSPVSVDPDSDNDGVGVEPVASSPRYTAASGSYPDGSNYTLTAYRSNLGLCVDLSATGSRGTGGGCAAAPTATHPISYAVDTFFKANATYLYGAVANDITTISASFTDGSTLTAAMSDSPAGLGFPGRFYIIKGSAAMGDLGATIIGRGPTGTVVGKTILEPHARPPLPQ